MDTPRCLTLALFCVAACASDPAQQPPVVTLTSPLGGEVLAGTADITWTPAASPTTVDVHLSLDSGASYGITIATGAPDTGSFSWNTTGFADSQTLRVRVAASAPDSPTSESPADFAVDNTAPVVALLSPVAASLVGTSAVITWSSTEVHPGTVHIEVSSDSGSTFSTVATAPDNGSYDWAPSGLTDGTTYRLRVVGTDATGNVGSATATSGDFELDVTDPVVAWVSPVGSDVWTGTQTISWTTTDANTGTVDVELSSNGGTTFTESLATGAADIGTLPFNTSIQLETTTARLRLTPTDAAGNTGVTVATADFAIDHTDPGVTMLSPNGGERLFGITSVRWTTTDAHPATVALSLSTDSGGAFSTNVASAAPDTGNYAWDTTGQPDGGRHRLRLEATDAAGNTATVESAGDFLVDNVALFASAARFTSTDAQIVLPMQFDSDGIPDIIHGTASGQLNRMYLSTGVAGQQYVYTDITTGTSSLTDAVDFRFDSDADRDLATAEDGAVRIWRNDSTLGMPAFTDTGIALGSGDLRVVRAIDLDGDSYDDLVAGYFGGPNRVWMNDGTGGMVSTGQMLGMDDTTSLEVMDVSGDGIPDLVIGAAGGQPERIWVGTGSGGMFNPAPAGTLPALTDDTLDIALADVDLDGDNDIITATAAGQQNRLLYNNANNMPVTWQFTEAAYGGGMNFPVTTTEARAVLTYNAENDGAPDVFLLNGDQRHEVFWNVGPGNFLDNSAFHFPYTDPTSAHRNIAKVDLGLDTDDDIFIALSGTGSPCFNNDAAMAMGQLLRGGCSIGAELIGSLAVGDLDGDGNLDVVAANAVAGEPNLVRVGGGDGTFIDGAPIYAHDGLLSGVATSAVALALLDGDTDLDLVLGIDGENRVYLGSTGATFTDTAQLLGSANTRAVALGPADANASIDLVTGELGGPNTVWFNDGSGNFTDSGQSLGSEDTYVVHLVNLDADPALEIVAGNVGALDRIYDNDGTGTFTDTLQTIGDMTTYAMAVGDVDGVMGPDLVIGVDGAGDQVWLNDGTGTFITSSQELGSSPTRSLQLGDVDNDGDLDLLAANAAPAPTRLWLNDGTGLFADSGQLLGTTDSSAVALGDFDGDGDLDAIEANADTAGRVWRND